MKHPLALKILRRLIFAVICLVTLIAFFIAEENLRGKLAWEHCKRDLEAQGEHLDMAYFIPPPVPDDQNFAMTPLFKSYFYDPATGKSDQRQRIQPLDKISIYDGGKGDAKLRLKEKIADWQTGNPRDLEAWQTYYRAAFPGMVKTPSAEEDVIIAINGINGVFAELREAFRTRPLSRFNIQYEKGVGANVHHYTPLHQMVDTLSLRATAELRLSRVGEAYEDVIFGFRLNNAVLSDPILIGPVVRMAGMNLLIGPVWEGIVSHHWTDSQLAAFQAQFQQIDFLAEYSRSMRMERATIYDLMMQMRKDPRLLGILMFEPMPRSLGAILPLMRFLPGWMYQNAATESRWLQENVSSVDAKTQRVDLPRALSEQERMEEMTPTPYTFMAKTSLQVLLPLFVKFSQAQTYANEATIACAIERYRLAHGALPATLDDLHMTDLPHDIINGEPLHYRVTGGDNYLLYSVGQNGMDDGGKVVTKEDGTIDIAQGDWVWSLKPLELLDSQK